MDDNTLTYLYAFGFMAVFVSTLALIYSAPFFIRAYFSGCWVSPLQIISMKLHRVPAMLIIKAMIELKKKGIEATVDEIEEVYLGHDPILRKAEDVALAFIEKQKEKSSK